VTEALDGWRQEAASFVALGGATIALIGAGVFLLWRQVRVVQRREHELAESEALKSGILASALDGIVSTDETGRIIEFNPAAEGIFGRRRADVLGQAVGPLLFPDGPAGLLDGLLAAAVGGGGGRSELQAVRADGEVFPAEITVTASRTDGGRVFTAYLRDITERRRTEAELRASHERADEANRAKSDFLATISHEIRTPMNGIIGMASILQDTSLSVEQQRYLATIQSSSEALLRLIDDLLDFSRLEAGRLELDLGAFAPGPVAAAAIDLVAPLAQAKGLMLGWRLGAAVPAELRGDAGRLRQVLLNLLGNAVKFTATGSVTLTVEPADAGAAIRFVVADTGIGIPIEAQDRVFGRFEQVDTSITRRFGGSGLGLAISKRLVERMGGQIGVESRPGTGSRFWFTIPAAGSRPAEPEAPPTDARVLVVDPDPAVRAVLVDQMRDWGVAADAADGGPAACGMAAEAEAARRPYGILVARRDLAGLPAAVPRRIAVAERPGPRALSPVHPDGLRRELAREAATGPALRILVAEDNPTNQQILATILRSLGHQVALAQNGREALDRAAADDFDLVLMDIQMPEMSGIEATRRIRALPAPRGRVPIVAATAMGSPEDRTAFLAAGMNGVLVKPITRAAVERAIAGEAAAAPRPERGPAAPDLDEAVLGPLAKALGQDTFRRLVHQLVEQTPAMLARLDEAREAGDASRLAATAHALSGSLRSFGLARAALHARSVETLARSGRVAEAQAEARRIPDAARLGLELLSAMATPAEPQG
ncbi:ATP-binding protein, partial [Stella sp.]|uniref:ATP-binding protein n=1 Tax=Stella sp. TaxID=2912054 RepID=UPI0035B2C3C3